MRISIIGSRGYPYVYGGYETFVKELVYRLHQRGVHVTVYCHRNLFNKKPSVVNGIHLIYVPTIQSKILSQPTNSFIAMIHACFSKVDVILVVNPANGPFGLVARIFRKKSVINVDGLEWLRPKWSGIGSKYFYFASWLATKLYHQIINDSEEMRRVYLEVFKKDSVVIAYGANIRYSSSPDLIKRWCLKAGKYYLIVGRLIPDNNADIIIQGFLRSNSNKKLVVVGDVPYKDKYAEKLKNLSKIDSRLVFTGYVNNQDELAELYHQSYVYIHGHEFGGTNPTMLKAMAYGCCIFALDTAFSREMLQNEKFGIYFKKDSNDIANKINLLDGDQNTVTSYKQNARKGITEKYTWDYVGDQYFNLFKKMINED